MAKMHPDLKLGFVLVVAAVLLTLGEFSGLAAVVSPGRNLSPTSYGLLLSAFGVGGLAVVAAAIWVDRRPPHTMMAAGAVVAAFGFAVIGLSNSFAAAVLAMFLAGVGSSAVDSVVFYAIVVKGARRYRGTLIGALVMVFTALLGSRQFVGRWVDDVPMIMFVAGIPLILVGAALLFRFLPRVFAGPYGPGQTLREELAVPGVRRAVAWVAVAFFAASMVTSTSELNFLFLMREPTPGVDEFVLRVSTIGIFSGIGALLCGIASDFYTGRRLFLLAALLLLPATGALWTLDGRSTLAIGTLAFGLVRGGLICLPWVLMADLLPTHHFAKIAFGITFVGGLLAEASHTLIVGLVLTAWGSDGVLLVILAEGIVLALVASRLPGPQAIEPGVQAM